MAPDQLNSNQKMFLWALKTMLVRKGTQSTTDTVLLQRLSHGGDYSDWTQAQPLVERVKQTLKQETSRADRKVRA